MTHANSWLAASWPVVRDHVPPPPARVLEIGCGPLGGFVPMLRGAGYEALGVDPEAPEGHDFRRVEFERLEAIGEVDAVVASASLHHVADPHDVLDRVAEILTPRGRVVVLEWDWEAFDEATAGWCFARLAPEGEHDWLRHHRDRWAASGLPWRDYLEGWAREERIHPARDLVALLDERFRCVHLADGPYLFADLPGTSEEEERAAIEAGAIRAARLEYVGVARGS